MNSLHAVHRAMTRGMFFSQTAGGLGLAALACLGVGGASASRIPAARPVFAGGTDFLPRAKRVIYLFQSGGPAHMDLFDYHPEMNKIHGQELPDSVRGGQRLTTMTSGQTSFPCVAPMFQFARQGASGTWFSETLPHLAGVADEMCVVKSMQTEAINHDPAITYFNTGSQQPGKPSLGSWLSYGIGSENQNLPAYVVLISQGSGRPGGQPLFSRLWSSGFLPSNHQGVRFRSGQSPVLFLANPPGIGAATQRQTLDRLTRLNEIQAAVVGDPEIDTRIAQYEMAFRMQASVPELVDLSGESDRTFELYGHNARKPGSFAANCILARRMAERGVRFIQLFHRGWDQHGDLPKALRAQCLDIDQPSAALIRDLKDRGLLDDTLIVWGGEFGRTIYCQGALSQNSYGRDHHGRCFTIWLAGGGIKGGFEYGRTDLFSYNVIENPVNIRDLNATLLHCLGIDHTSLSFKFQGLEQRLTGVEPARVVHEILS